MFLLKQENSCWCKIRKTEAKKSKLLLSYWKRYELVKTRSVPAHFFWFYCLKISQTTGGEKNISWLMSVHLVSSSIFYSVLLGMRLLSDVFFLSAGHWQRKEAATRRSSRHTHKGSDTWSRKRSGASPPEPVMSLSVFPECLGLRPNLGCVGGNETARAASQLESFFTSDVELKGELKEDLSAGV